MKKDGSQIRRQFGRSTLQHEPSRVAKTERSQMTEIKIMARREDGGEDLSDEVFNAGEETVSPPKKTAAKKPAAKKEPPADEPEVEEDPVIEEDEAPAEVAVADDIDVPGLIDDEEDDITLSLVSSINLAAETFQAFGVLIQFMDTHLHERKLKYEQLSEMMKPDQEGTVPEGEILAEG